MQRVLSASVISSLRATALRRVGAGPAVPRAGVPAAVVLRSVLSSVRGYSIDRNEPGFLNVDGYETEFEAVQEESPEDKPKETREEYAERIKNVRCFLCNEYGHIARTCPTNPVNGDGGRLPGGRMPRCFNCGKEGHIAPECPKPRRDPALKICYNCGEDGHTSYACPHPPSRRQFAKGERREKFNPHQVCNICGIKGHIAPDCPEKGSDFVRIRSRICYNCGLTGHMSSDCQNPKSETPIPRGKKRRVVKCFNCGEEGHSARDCPMDKRCNICQTLGHIARDCPDAFSRGNVCYACGESGHFSNRCPNKTVNESKNKKVNVSEVGGLEIDAQYDPPQAPWKSRRASRVDSYMPAAAAAASEAALSYLETMSGEEAGETEAFDASKDVDYASEKIAEVLLEEDEFISSFSSEETTTSAESEAVESETAESEAAQSEDGKDRLDRDEDERK